MKFKWSQSKNKLLFCKIGIQYIKTFDVQDPSSPIMTRYLDSPQHQYNDFQLESHLVRLQERDSNQFLICIVDTENILKQPFELKTSHQPLFFGEFAQQYICIFTTEYVKIVSLSQKAVILQFRAKKEIKQALIINESIFIMYQDILTKYQIRQNRLVQIQNKKGVTLIDAVNSQLICIINQQLVVGDRLFYNIKGNVLVKKAPIRNTEQQILLVGNQDRILVIYHQFSKQLNWSIPQRNVCDICFFGQYLSEDRIGIFYYFVSQKQKTNKFQKQFLTSMFLHKQQQLIQNAISKTSTVFLNNGILNPEVQSKINTKSIQLDYQKGGASFFIFKYLLQNSPSNFVKIAQDFKPNRQSDFHRFILYLNSALDQTKQYITLQQFTKILISKYNFDDKQTVSILSRIQAKIRIFEKADSLQNQLKEKDNDILLNFQSINSILKTKQSAGQQTRKLFFQFFPQSNVINVQNIKVDSLETLIKFIKSINDQYVADYFIGRVSLQLLKQNRSIIKSILQTEKHNSHKKNCKIVSNVLGSEHKKQQIFKYLIYFCIYNQEIELALLILHSHKLDWKANLEYLIRFDCQHGNYRILYHFEILGQYKFTKKQIDNFLMIYFRYLQESDNLRVLARFPIGLSNINVIKPFLQNLKHLKFD